MFNLGAEAARFTSPMTLEPALGHGFESSFEGGVVTLPGYGAFFGTVAGSSSRGIREAVMADITMRQLKKSFGQVDVIKGVDLDIRNKEFVVFVGPSGCGKSTLLRLVAGLEDITSGRLMFDGEEVNDLPPAERGIAMVFQSYALYPHMSVYENMAFGLKLAKLGKEGIEERVRKRRASCRSSICSIASPSSCPAASASASRSAGRSCATRSVFLFDEPLSNLDAALRVQMRIEIAKLHHSLDATMIYVTHDQVEAMTLADRIVVLNAGVVEQFGSPLELYHHPQNLFVAGFIGSPKMNFLQGEIAGGTDNAVTVRLADGATLVAAGGRDGARSGEKVTVGMRPEHLLEGGGATPSSKARWSRSSTSAVRPTSISTAVSPSLWWSRPPAIPRSGSTRCCRSACRPRPATCSTATGGPSPAPAELPAARSCSVRRRLSSRARLSRAVP